MSLNFDTCKEVVEKVWGMKEFQIKNIFNEIELSTTYVYSEWRKQWMQVNVNSWEGFGRTVEAMVKKGYHPSAVIKSRCSTVEQVAKLTHLAALEAIKQEDEG